MELIFLQQQVNYLRRKIRNLVTVSANWIPNLHKNCFISNFNFMTICLQYNVSLVFLVHHVSLSSKQMQRSTSFQYSKWRKIQNIMWISFANWCVEFANYFFFFPRYKAPRFKEKKMKKKLWNWNIWNASWICGDFIYKCFYNCGCPLILLFYTIIIVSDLRDSFIYN